MSEEPPQEVLLATYIITFLIGFPNSVLAFFSCIRKIHIKPIPIDIIMLNLAISDLIFLTCLPIKMKEAADNMVWKMPSGVCRSDVFVYLLPVYSSSLFLTAIGAERYVCIAFPVKYRSPKRIIYTIPICVVIWVLVAAIFTFVYKAVSTDSGVAVNTTNQQTERCYSNFTEKQLAKLLPVQMGLAVVFFFLPLLTCCFCYINFIRNLLKLPLIKRQRRLRAVGLALGTLLVFASCFAPYNISHVVAFVKKENPKWRTTALILSTLNACYDPIIFFCISREMRSAIKVCAKFFFRCYAYLKGQFTQNIK
ncbi:free fatty acid receptor 2 [Rhinichthys klamathensis goyatoka]|uniref:free fatty acid receptor 2 n=1 Tax=Rhinichthys klamathensis goyatoka TaxID=3034132 RepID=UPI0024B5F6A8|nr:free fatty acid receptor 2 [Rhinichthys klamathensis goyatoka]